MSDRFPDHLLDQIKAAVPITELVGQYVVWDAGKSNPSRRDMWANCPLHGENTPSFHAQDSEGRFHCFGCGADGDHFEFLMQNQGLNFPETVGIVAELGGVDLPDNGPQSNSAGAGQAKAPREPEQPRNERHPPQPRAQREGRVPVKEYAYTDNDGNLLYEVVRFQIRLPDGSWAKTKDGKGTWKTFLHRRPSGLPDGSHVWGVKEGDYLRPGPGRDWSPWKQDKADKYPDHEVRWFDAVETTIYRHPAVEVAIAEGQPVVIVEGEKDADTVTDLGLCGTTNSAGSQHWTDTHSACFRDADVVICLDNDEAGARADRLAKSLKGIARRIRVLDFAHHVPNFPAKHDVTDWREAGGTADELRRIIDSLPDWRPPLPHGFGASAFSQLAGSPIVYDWLIKGLVERNGVFIFAGEKQAGKSFAVMDMGMKIARGIQYGDRITRKGVVIHMACEDGRGVKMRAEGYRKANDLPDDANVPYIIMDREFTLMSDEVIEKFIVEVKAWAEYYDLPVELIIIDTLSVATEGLNEIDGAEVGKVLSRVNRLKEATGAAICLVHHMNASGGRVRGHTSIEANVSQVFEIRPLMSIPQNRKDQPEPILDGDGRHIRQIVLTKNKNGLNNLKWKVVLDVVHLGRDTDGDQITTCVLAKPTRSRNAEPGESDTKLTQDQKLVLDALRAAQEDSGADMPAGVRVGPQVKRCAPQTAFVAQVRKIMNFKAPEEEHEARLTEMQAFLKRTTTALQNAGYMGRDNDLKIVWWTGKSDRLQPRRQQPEEPPPAPPPIPDDVRQEIEQQGVPF